MDRLAEEGRLVFSARGFPRLKLYLDEMPGTPCDDIWMDISPINSQAAERLGYPTQKPMALLERIIAASSNEGDLVLDPFCGCGTAVVAAQKLGRRWIGIDITTLAVSLIKRRLLEHFPDVFPKADSISVEGFPADVAGARVLAETDRYAFQFWTLTMIGASPAGGRAKKGADKGIDGEFSWRDASDSLCRGLVSVKSGHITVNQVRDLVGTMQREKAELGIFATLEEPSKPMRNEAAGAGRYSIPGIPKDFPRVQILTVDELLTGRDPDVPRWRLNPFRQAQEIAKDQQVALDMD
jgi:site-specific DNA-methyltransferase (adenine-specific)